MGSELLAEMRGPESRAPSVSAWPPAERLLTADEVAVRLGVQPSWVNRAARANRIPHVRVGRYRRFRWQDLEAWLQGQSVA